MACIKTYQHIFNQFYRQYLVLLTMVPRNSVVTSIPQQKFLRCSSPACAAVCSRRHHRDDQQVVLATSAPTATCSTSTSINPTMAQMNTITKAALIRIVFGRRTTGRLGCSTPPPRTLPPVKSSCINSAKAPAAILSPNAQSGLLM